MRSAIIAGILAAALTCLAACSSSGGSSPSAPGGSARSSTLEQHHLLVDGKVQAGEAAGPRSTQQALCSYLFGSPQAVAGAARLSGTATLTSASGFVVLGSNGDAYRCLYSVGGTETLLLEIRTKPAEGDITGVAAVQVRAHGRQALMVYRPGYTGPTIAKSDATAWLTAAIGRVKTDQ